MSPQNQILLVRVRKYLGHSFPINELVDGLASNSKTRDHGMNVVL